MILMGLVTAKLLECEVTKLTKMTKMTMAEMVYD